jgi:hypothetical protein
MDEHIRAVFLGDEAVALAAVEPFYRSISHADILLLSQISQGPRLEDVTWRNVTRLQKETGPPIKDGPLLITKIIEHSKIKSKQKIFRDPSIQNLAWYAKSAIVNRSEVAGCEKFDFDTRSSSVCR